MKSCLTISLEMGHLPCEQTKNSDLRKNRMPIGPHYPSLFTTSGIDKGLGIFSSAEVPDSFLPPAIIAGLGRQITNRRAKHAGGRLNQPRLKEGRSMALIASRDWRLVVVGEIPRRLLHGAGVPEYHSKLRPPSPRRCVFRKCLV